MGKNPFYTTAWCTDKGIRKNHNEDSALIMQAETNRGPMLLAVICDGMGGLAKGEVASAMLIKMFESWFRQQLPELVELADFPEALRLSWLQLLQDANEQIAAYGRERGCNLGTTVSALLLAEGYYYITNIGDSRVYLLDERICQLTHDQTLVQYQVDIGVLTPEEARVDPKRNVLLQCIGASENPTPDFYADEVSTGQRFLLCCDGFRHEITPEEMRTCLGVEQANTREAMFAQLEKLVELNKERKERDNITAILVCV